MSHVDPGPLASYESLADPNLTGYFNNSRMRRHLRKTGLINKRGDIVSEKVFRLNNSRKDHQRHIRDVLAQAIIHKALDMERHRQMSIKQQLEKIAKVERVRKIRAERALRGDEDILPLLSPRAGGKHKHKRHHQNNNNIQLLKTVTDGEETEQYPQHVGYPAIPDDTPHNTRTDRMKTPYPNAEVDNQHLYSLDRDALRSFTLNLSEFDLGSGVSPYSGAKVPNSLNKTTKKKRRPATASGALGRSGTATPKSNARSLQLHRKEPPMLHHTQIHTLCRVTFKYLGKMVHLDREEEDPRDTVEVMQQHCGGENLRLFKGQVMPGETFMIISKRHRTFPFSLSFYLNGVQVERISTCCEYKHKPGYKLGAKTSHFGLVKVEGSQPCFKCMVSKGKLKTRPEPTPPPSAHQKPKKKRVRKSKHDKAESDFTDSSTAQNKSVEEETEVHHDAGKDDSDSSSVISSKSDSTISSLSESDDDENHDDGFSFLSDKKGSSHSSKSSTSSKSTEKHDESESSDSDTTVKSEYDQYSDDKFTGKSSSSSVTAAEDATENAKNIDETKPTVTEEPELQKKEDLSDKDEKTKSKFVSNSEGSSSSSSSSSDSSDTETESKYESIVPYIKNKTVIDMSGKLLSNAQCDEFYSYLLRHPSSLNIQEVILKDCRLGDNKTCQILKSFLTTKCLKVLDLTNNNLTSNSCHVILDICLGNPLEVLRLNNNPLENKGVDVIMSGLIKTQRSANNHVMEKKTAHSLVSTIIRDTKKELGSEVDSQAASEKSSATSSVFHELISLTKLTLDDVKVSKSGLDCVVDFIKLNPKLTFLNISSNAIGKKTLHDLGIAIANNYCLKNIELNKTNLKDNNTVEFLNLIKDRTTPINLSMKDNNLTDEGALRILDILTETQDCSIGKLILTPGNKINSKIIHKIRKAVKSAEK